MTLVWTPEVLQKSDQPIPKIETLKLSEVMEGMTIQIVGSTGALSEIMRIAEMGFTINTPRSEERRVGKECRSRWSPYH